MKKYYFLLLLFCGMMKAQIVNIPDANFKAKLLASSATNSIAKNLSGQNFKIDANSNGEIEVAEALQVSSLSVDSSNIVSAVGINSFTNLLYLDIQNNFLTILDLTALENLKLLLCLGNNLTTLNVSGLQNLETLSCEQNAFVTLDVSGLTSLNYLNCQGNSLTTLTTTGCVNLQTIECDGNDLTSLDLSTLINLKAIQCGYNQLVTLNIANCVNLETLSCGGNAFTTLNLNNNIHLKALYIYGCQNLQTLFLRNGSDESTNVDSGSWLENWANLPSLLYVCVDENEVIPLKNLFENPFITVNPEINTYCSFTPGGDYNTITGRQSFDADNNGCDSGNLVQSYMKININDGTTTGSAFTNAEGNYKFYTQAGNFILTPELDNPTYFIVNPTTTTFNFPLVNNAIAQQDFCMIANGNHQDLEIVIAPIIPARPGFDAVYKIVYRNNGNQTMALDYGVNFFYNHNLMSFVGADVVPTTNGPGALSWNYTDLKPFETRTILVTVNINPPTHPTNPVNIGDVLTFNTAISPIGSDENQLDNYGVFNQIVVGSYDPNDIQCIEGDVIAPTEIGKYLHYLIRFENTGTAAAENIVVKTVINPNDFDVQSLRLLNASHLVDARVTGNVIEFIFKGIMLDSGGHGNILLKVKSKSDLTTGESVSNQADIFFDYNFPVATNNAETTFQLLRTGDNPKVEMTLYPNPTDGIISINSKDTIRSIEIYDIQGRILQTKIENQTNSSLDISSRKAGVYFVKITTDKGTRTEKIVKK